MSVDSAEPTDNKAIQLIFLREWSLLKLYFIQKQEYLVSMQYTCV